MLTEDRVIKVGISDLKCCKGPYRLRTSGLGSCVGVILYDSTAKIAGMAHVMLPHAALQANKELEVPKGKYADRAVFELVREIKELGANVSKLQAKIAGGAQMFALRELQDAMRIGERNVTEVKRQLDKWGIPIVSEDTGGKNGRTIEFEIKTCTLHIRTVNKGVLTI
ncbi:chemotaxis protein CheD [Bacillus fonticola]|uniref:chemotaxis protein CheD n=1 Tax=Bacillus fonticola TaxID=2728853 RepID=UPI0014750A48|nr:chemotaxis protein CheD [Bacillus fonticola]